MRVVLDTNVYVSAFVFPGGAPDEIVRLALARQVTPIVSEEILKEFSRVLIQRFRYTPKESERFGRLLRSVAEVSEPVESVETITADPADNRVLECAIVGGTEYIITGDKKHILPLGEFRGIPVVSPRQFLDIWYT